MFTDSDVLTRFHIYENVKTEMWSCSYNYTLCCLRIISKNNNGHEIVKFLSKNADKNYIYIGKTKDDLKLYKLEQYTCIDNLLLLDIITKLEKMPKVMHNENELEVVRDEIKNGPMYSFYLYLR